MARTIQNVPDEGHTVVSILEVYLLAHYCFISFCRLALPLWFLTIILFFILLKYGAYFLMLTGGVMIIANILWATIRNFNELMIPLTAEHVLEFHFGGAYWVNLITGVYRLTDIFLSLLQFCLYTRFSMRFSRL